MGKQNPSLIEPYLTNSALIEVDRAQKTDEITKVTEIREFHRHLSDNLADYQAETDRYYRTVRPNLVKLVDTFRRNSLPIIFIVFSYEQPEAMDLEPGLRDFEMKHCGPDVSKWELPRRSDSKVRPPDCLNVTARNYVVNKTGHDGFISSNLDFVLRNLGVKNLFFCGGHTNCCVRFTAASAVQRGYSAILVEDACIDLLLKLHKEGVKAVQYKEIVTTRSVLDALERFSLARQRRSQ